MPRGLDQISVVAAMDVRAHPGTPMLHTNSQNRQRTHAHALVPAHFLHALIAGHTQQVAGIFRRYHGRSGAFQATQRGQIEMIEMRMRKQNQIDMR